MPPSGNKVGVIILGNSGVGKSFLANVILGNESFAHAYQMDAVTLTTEYLESTFDGQTYAIYDIPGLIEAEEERIDVNIREINIAFQQHPNAVVLSVFGTVNGKIRNEDVVAFNAIHAAYPLSEKSLVVIVNNVKPDRPDNYDFVAEKKLSHLLKMRLPQICFVSEISNSKEKAQIRKQLIQSITHAIPKNHNKKEEINLKTVETLTSEVDELLKKFEKQQLNDELEMKNVMEKQREERAALEWRMRTEQYERDRQRILQEEAKERRFRAAKLSLEKQMRVRQWQAYQEWLNHQQWLDHQRYLREQRLIAEQQQLKDEIQKQSEDLRKLRSNQRKLRTLSKHRSRK